MNKTSANNTGMNNATANEQANISGADGKFTYRSKLVDPASLSIHPLLLKLGTVDPNEFFLEEMAYFNYVERPLVTADGHVITHATEVLAAQKLGKDTIECMEFENASQSDIVRMIDFKKNWKHGKDRGRLSELITWLEEFFKTADGKAWASSLPGSKIRDKIARVLGVSAGTIHNIKVAAAAGKDVLEGIDKGSIVNKDVLPSKPQPSTPQVTQTAPAVIVPLFTKPESSEPFTSTNKYKMYSLNNIPNGSKLDGQSKEEREAIMLFMDFISGFAVEEKDGELKITHDKLKGMTHCLEIIPQNEKHQDIHSHVISVMNGAFSMMADLRGATEMRSAIGRRSTGDNGYAVAA